MAAKGYFETHKIVREDLIRIVGGENSGTAFRQSLSRWYQALFSPSVQAGILKPADLAGYRNDQVFIRGAQHVPPSKDAVRDCMPVLFELLEAEEVPAVREMPDEPDVGLLRICLDRHSRRRASPIHECIGAGKFVRGHRTVCSANFTPHQRAKATPPTAPRITATRIERSPRYLRRHRQAEPLRQRMIAYERVAPDLGPAARSA